uniref:uncharacterized protein LOC122604498 n=1 Tax=Erigeron canadensis TaxID=72917 RepID=UPI001CB91F2F|nr:uncharacterized protein LOC122604498 [Erigeron canadensis]
MRKHKYTQSYIENNENATQDAKEMRKRRRAILQSRKTSSQVMLLTLTLAFPNRILSNITNCMSKPVETKNKLFKTTKPSNSAFVKAPYSPPVTISSTTTCVTLSNRNNPSVTTSHVFNNSYIGTTSTNSSTFAALNSKISGKPHYNIRNPCNVYKKSSSKNIGKNNMNAQTLLLNQKLHVSKENIAYIDHGDAIYKCSKCNAMLWEAEMLRGNHDLKKTAFGFCCSSGDVQLPPPPEPPAVLKKLFKEKNQKSNNFMSNIRAYNMMFSFTSMGGKIDKTVMKGKGPFVFRLQGQNFHRMGSLMPGPGEQPKFSQLYIYDSENEAANREKAVSDGRDRKKQPLDHNTIDIIKNMLDLNNPLVKSFRMVRDCVKDNDWETVGLKLIGTRKQDARQCNLPTTSELAGLIIGDIDDMIDNRDIVLRTKVGGLQRISELHPSYLALQYPLLFPYGEDGYRIDIKHRGIPLDSNIVRSKKSMREFFAYMLQIRPKSGSLLLFAKKLLHQFMVDAYTMIESERLSYIKTQQKKLHTETYKNLTAAVENGNDEGSSSGKRIFLPSSFTGGARYMMQKYLMLWQFAKRCLVDIDLKPEDRPDILSRIFKIKLDYLIQDLKTNEFFGPIEAVIYTVEFQKRGLPHAHLCLFLKAGHKFPTVTDIDHVISAEIPDKEEDPELYELVKQFMMHGPCGADNPSCPCMVQRKCSKNFPKDFHEESSVDSSGYLVY